MTRPLYTTSSQNCPEKLPKDGNCGLWFTRFYCGFDHDWEVANGAKLEWINTVCGSRGDREMLEAMTKRMAALGKGLNAKVADFSTESSFATGLGLSHPVENGFTWHPTLGIPYLPASGVKGLLRAWVETWMEHASTESCDELVGRWFGSSSTNNSENSAGNLIFFDALPTAPLPLIADVMTPHMGKWYEQGDQIKSPSDYGEKAPADWHSPIPVQFLSVARGAHFRFMIAPRLTGNSASDCQTQADVAVAMQQLALALEWVGAGAKTASGYGRMHDPQAKRAAELAEAGIASGNTVWPKAKVTRNKSTGEISVVSASGDRAAPIRNPRATEIFKALSETEQKALKDGKKPLEMTAEVEITGNLVNIIGLTSS